MQTSKGKMVLLHATDVHAGLHKVVTYTLQRRLCVCVCVLGKHKDVSKDVNKNLCPGGEMFWSP